MTVEQREVLGVHLGNEQRDRLIEAVSRRVTHHGEPRARECGLGLAGDVRRKAREDDVAVERRPGRLHNQ